MQTEMLWSGLRACLYIQISLALLLQACFSFKTVQACTKAGETLAFTCYVEDEGRHGGTVWNGTIFNCTSRNSISHHKVYLSHRRENVAEFCNDGDIVGVNVGQLDGSLYMSTLNVTTTPEMHNGTVTCSYLGVRPGRLGSQQTTVGTTVLEIGVVPAPPSQITVISTNSTANSERQFILTWSAPDNVVGGVGSYMTTVTGDCGHCSNIGRISTDTTQISCSGWVARGQTCNFTVATVSADCGFESPPCQKLINLIYPLAPEIRSVVPTYSIDGGLDVIEALIYLVEGTTDDNEFPISYGITITHTSGGECTKELALGNCMDDQLCNLAITLGADCNLLAIQDGSFRVDAYARTLFGNSAVSTPDVIDAVNKMMNLTVYSEATFTLLNAQFTSSIGSVSATLRYNAKTPCKTFTSQKSVVWVNTTDISLTLFDVIDTCFELAIETSSSNLKIHGDFPSGEEGIIRSSIHVLILATTSTSILLLLASALFIVTCPMMLRYKQSHRTSVIKEKEPVYDVVEESPRVPQKRNPAYGTTGLVRISTTV